MFGSFGDDEFEAEHRLSPILKMIDLGSVERVDISREEEWHRISENLINLAGSRFFPLFETSQSLGAQQIDPELRDLVMVCTRKAGTFRDRGWSLRDLDDMVQRGFERGPEYYRDTLGMEGDAEEDDAVVRVVRELFLDAAINRGLPPSEADFDEINSLVHPNDSDISI
ncbi:hypothetical protein PG985_008122 [Apiospora marii]|uniref:uncharacterized protein n=1 Tax=Apiospora marii TaxID=335849 RepID=UPI00312F3040